MPNSLYFDTTFAENGDLVAVPDGTQSDGSVSYNQGYGIAYSTPVASGGYNFPRGQHNQILNDVTNAIQLMQQNGCFSFITTAMNNGTPYSYKLGASCLYDAGGGAQVWVSSAASNTTTPGAVGAHWNPLTSSSSPLFIGGTTTGSANAQAVATDQGDYANTAGNIVTFKAGITVTTTSTLSVDAVSNIPLKIMSSAGVRNTANGEITSGGEYIAISDGTNLQVLNPTCYRTRLTGNATYYVSNSGNDTTGNGTTGTPWATFQYARNYVAQNIDCAGFTVTYQFQGSGPYTSTTALSFSLVPANTPEIFDGAGQTISTTSADCFTLIGDGINFTPQNIKLQTATSGNCLTIDDGARLNLGVAVNFGACANQHMSIASNGLGNIQQNYTISGGAINHWAADLSSALLVNGRTITLTGTPAFTTFASSQESSGIQCQGNTYTGAATGVQYIALLNGTINTNGATTNWPTGLTAGAVQSGGQII